MKVILFGASGMVGAGALREILLAPEVERVLSVGRRTCGVSHPKLRELLLPDLFDLVGVEDQLAGYDACIWAVGVSSVGLNELGYARVTEELTLARARRLLRLNPGMSFCYCSAAGAARRCGRAFGSASRARRRRCRSGTRVRSGRPRSGRARASGAVPGAIGSAWCS